MKILCFGSLNLDHVYQVSHIVKPGETTTSSSFDIFDGGKGLNQALALGRANADCYMSGMIGKDGIHLIKSMESSHVNATYVGVSEDNMTGHTIIQVDKNGQNSIICYAGANHMIDDQFVHKVLSNFEPGDFILLQNEINNIPYIMEQAKKKGMKVVFNPSPITEQLLNYPLHLVDMLLLNEIEGYELTKERDFEAILKKLNELYPKTLIVLTLGKNGALFSDGETRYHHGIYDVKVVDTTAAGDTFTGYFLAAYANNEPIDSCLKIASIASSLAVSRPGASASIPFMSEVKDCKLSLVKS